MKLNEMLTWQQKTELFLAGCRSAGIEIKESVWWEPTAEEKAFQQRRNAYRREMTTYQTIAIVGVTIFITEIAYLGYLVFYGLLK